MRRMLFLLFLGAQCFAALEWESPESVEHVMPGESFADAEFIYTNTGDSALTIDRVVTTCGCITTRTDAAPIRPGQTGFVNGRFTFEDRIGNQRKRFVVVTSDGGQHHLYLTVDIPEVYRPSTRMLTWAPDDRSAKSIRFVNLSAEPILIEKVVTSDPLFQGTLHEIREGFEYDVRFVPPQDALESRSTAMILTKPPAGHDPLTYRVYLHKQ